MSGGKKKRADLRQGQQQFNQFAGQAIDTLRPFSEGGLPAFNNANALLGLGGDQNAANQNFRNSLFYTGGENAFNTDRDAIDSGLSSQGLLFSSARQRAVEEARNRNFQNAFSQYLGLNQSQAGLGAQTAGNIANLQFGQGNAALNTSQNIANTRQGFLGTLGQLAGIGGQFAGAATGFSDRRLKADIEHIGNDGPLPRYKWKWNEHANGLGLEGHSSGYMADEVERVFPDAVFTGAYDYKMVDYVRVSEHLER